MRKRDILAVSMVALCILLLGSSYFLTTVNDDFINIIYCAKIIMMALTIGYLYLVYVHKKN